MTSKTAGAPPPNDLTPLQRSMPKVNKVTPDDIAAALRAAKSELDPSWMLNPGVLIDR